MMIRASGAASSTRRASSPVRACMEALRITASSPVAHAPGVDVHEVAARVIAHAPEAEGACVRGELERRIAAEANVDGAALEMHAVHGHTLRAAMQHRIGCRRAVTGDHFEG